ncbi:MAG: hypothetical protein BAA04_12565 [Firmicutes bacterium ZCTH02-B6]|nr:MAG: hypothetical protein BAA04_12565 [Firmicutes bacterium ZCTH02-B6]
MAERPVALPSQTRDVVSYEDDVFAWMYLDQLDGLVRYEAYVIGYDDAGRPTTLAFVLEEGAFPIDHFPLVHALWNASRPGRLSAEDWRALHAFFEEQEKELKRARRHNWIHRLRALGYDVINAL